MTSCNTSELVMQEQEFIEWSLPTDIEIFAVYFLHHTNCRSIYQFQI